MIPSLDDRVKQAYSAFRGGFRGVHEVPHWDDAPAWVRDLARVAYLQGVADTRSKEQ